MGRNGLAIVRIVREYVTAKGDGFMPKIIKIKPKKVELKPKLRVAAYARVSTDEKNSSVFLHRSVTTTT